MARVKKSSSESKTERYNFRKHTIRQADSKSATATNSADNRRRACSKKPSNAAPTRKSYRSSNMGQYRAINASRLDDDRVKLDQATSYSSRRLALADLQNRFPPTSIDAQPVLDDPALCGILGLNRSDQAKDVYLSRIEQKSIAPLGSCYPPMRQYAAESTEAAEYWEARWHYTAVKDSRKPFERRPIMLLDRSKMTIVRRDQSVIFYDPKDPARPVLFVDRDFVQDEEVAATIGIMSLDSTISRRGDRRDDPGDLGLIGYTSGPRNDRKLGMANNLYNKVDVERIDRKNGGIMALLWNIMRQSLPAIIIDDFDDKIEELDLPRLSTPYSEGAEIELGRGKYRFTTEQLAPPTTLTAWNYAAATHRDTNANEYMISYTYEANVDPGRGGNFYLAKYGILVEQAPNTCVAWMTKDTHGTTLADPIDGRHNYGGGEEEFEDEVEDEDEDKDEAEAEEDEVM